MAYNGIKKEQEEEDVCNAAIPLHLKTIWMKHYYCCSLSRMHRGLNPSTNKKDITCGYQSR